MIASFDKEQLKVLPLSDLAKLKQDTTKFTEECKEFQGAYENLQQQVKELEIAVDEEMNPNTKNYKVTLHTFILFLYLMYRYNVYIYTHTI